MKTAKHIAERVQWVKYRLAEFPQIDIDKLEDGKYEDILLYTGMLVALEWSLTVDAPFLRDDWVVDFNRVYD